MLRAEIFINRTQSSQDTDPLQLFVDGKRIKPEVCLWDLDLEMLFPDGDIPGLVALKLGDYYGRGSYLVLKSTTNSRGEFQRVGTFTHHASTEAERLERRFQMSPLPKELYLELDAKERYTITII